ncbi:hypothetical protein ACFQZK_00580 [Rhodococcus aetherivorans]
MVLPEAQTVEFGFDCCSVADREAQPLDLDNDLGGRRLQCSQPVGRCVRDSPATCDREMPAECADRTGALLTDGEERQPPARCGTDYHDDVVGPQ